MDLPPRPPRDHDWFEIPSARVDVSFTDEQGVERRVTTRYKRTGRGRPLVLVHGLMTTSYSFRFVHSALAARYDVIAPDLVGAGESDAPTDMVYSAHNVARFLRAFVATQTPEPVYLVGNSLGGLYSLTALLEEEASDTFARRFVLIHAPGYPFARTRLLHTLLDAPGIGRVLAEGVARVSHAARRPFVAKNVHYRDTSMMSEEEVREYGRIFETLDGARVFARILRESLDPDEHARILARAKGRDDLPPTLVLFAREDVMVPPSFGPLFARDLAGSRLVWVDDASHFVQVDAPERTVQEIFDFDAPSATVGA